MAAEKSHWKVGRLWMCSVIVSLTYMARDGVKC